MTFGLFSGGGPQTRCEFVRMKGPQGKGHAEMAVTKPKGSGVETPTSEPGFCMTDMYDDWEEDPDDYFQRHQRRLSDPSANLNDYSRYGWKTKPTTSNAQTKAMSQNEGLDSLINEVSEIEAGDLRDGRFIIEHMCCVYIEHIVSFGFIAFTFIFVCVCEKNVYIIHFISVYYFAFRL